MRRGINPRQRFQVVYEVKLYMRLDLSFPRGVLDLSEQLNGPGEKMDSSRLFPSQAYCWNIYEMLSKMLYTLL
jgi:hypothetical protein